MLTAAGQPDADIEEALKDGRAMDKWRQMIREQDGDPDAPLPVAKHTHDVLAEEDGTLTKLDALAVGVASWRLGAGRASKGEAVQLAAGIELYKKPGDTVKKGDKLMTFHTDEEGRIPRALESLEGGIEIGAHYTPTKSVILIESPSEPICYPGAASPRLLSLQSRVRGHKTTWPRTGSPTTPRASRSPCGRLRQSSPRTCGAMVAVVSRMLMEEDFRARLRNVHDVEAALLDLCRDAVGPISWPACLDASVATGTHAFRPCAEVAWRSGRVIPEYPCRYGTDSGKAIPQWVWHAVGVGLPVPLYTGGDKNGVV